jgi:hypothetical protein
MRRNNINIIQPIDPRSNKFINNSSLILPNMQDTQAQFPDLQDSSMNKPMVNNKYYYYYYENNLTVN